MLPSKMKEVQKEKGKGKGKGKIAPNSLKMKEVKGKEKMEIDETTGGIFLGGSSSSWVGEGSSTSLPNSPKMKVLPKGKGKIASTDLPGFKTSQEEIDTDGENFQVDKTTGGISSGGSSSSCVGEGSNSSGGSSEDTYTLEKPEDVFDLKGGNAGEMKVIDKDHDAISAGWMKTKLELRSSQESLAIDYCFETKSPVVGHGLGLVVPALLLLFCYLLVIECFNLLR